MKVWRYQSDDGVGAYQGLGVGAVECDRDRHPIPPKQILYTICCSRYNIFGFPSRKAARRWFRPEEAAYLKRCGVRLRCYKVQSLLWRTKQQCIFDVRSAKLLKDR